MRIVIDSRKSGLATSRRNRSACIVDRRTGAGLPSALRESDGPRNWNREQHECHGALQPPNPSRCRLLHLVSGCATEAARRLAGIQRGAATRCTLVITESLSLICERPVLPDGFGVGGRRSAVPPRPPPLRVFAAALANARQSATPAC